MADKLYEKNYYYNYKILSLKNKIEGLFINFRTHNSGKDIIDQECNNIAMMQ